MMRPWIRLTVKSTGAGLVIDAGDVEAVQDEVAFTGPGERMKGTLVTTRHDNYLVLESAEEVLRVLMDVERRTESELCYIAEMAGVRARKEASYP